MEAAEEIKDRIRSVRDLQALVKTMKALSAASIRQYEIAAEALNDYYATIELGLSVVLKDLSLLPAETERAGAGVGAVVFGSDHGLCGRFNDDIATFALAHLPAGEARRVVAVGARTAALLEQSGQPVDGDFLVPASAARITATVQQLLLKLEAWRSEADVTRVYLFYNRYHNGGAYTPTAWPLLPLDIPRLRQLAALPWRSRSLPTFTMDRKTLFQALLRQYLFVSVARAAAESLASEHGARLAAMQSAQKNLDDRLDRLAADFRRVRQDTITEELLDVVAGFEALAEPAE